MDTSQRSMSLVFLGSSLSYFLEIGPLAELGASQLAPETLMSPAPLHKCPWLHPGYMGDDDLLRFLTCALSALTHGAISPAVISGSKTISVSIFTCATILKGNQTPQCGKFELSFPKERERRLECHRHGLHSSGGCTFGEDSQHQHSLLCETHSSEGQGHGRRLWWSPNPAFSF